MLTNTKLVYPYDRRPLEESFLERRSVQNYGADELKNYQFPLKHPAYTALAGSFECSRDFPNWWSTLIELSPYPIKYFLPSITVEEFFAGIVDSDRWKLFRTFLPTEQKKLIPQSPKIGGMLTDNPYETHFNSRGAIGGTTFQVHITDRPEDLFFMSNGSGWSSCMSRTGSYSSGLKSVMFDPSTSMAYVLDTGKESLSSMNAIIARALLRVMHVPGDNTPYVVVDKVYGNDAAIQGKLPGAIMDYALSKGFQAGASYNRTGPTAVSLIGYVSSSPATWNWGYMDTFSYMYENTVTVDSQEFTTAVITGNVRQYEK